MKRKPGFLRASARLGLSICSGLALVAGCAHTQPVRQPWQRRPGCDLVARLRKMQGGVLTREQRARCPELYGSH